MNQEDLELNIVAQIDFKDVEKDTKKMGDFIEQNIGKKINNAYKIDKKNSLAFFGSKDGKYHAIRYNTTSGGKVANKNFDYNYMGSYSEEEAKRLAKSSSTKELNDRIKSVRKERLLKQKIAIDSQKETKDQKESSKDRISGVKKLANTIKRVGFYRIARNLFRLIENGFKQGISDLINFSDEANKTFSGFTSAFRKINASIALSLYPIFESLLPLVDGLANGISNFANSISMASASMKGLSEYTKINEEYMEDLQKTANNFAFDTFQSLNAQESPYTTAKITDEDQENLQRGISLLSTIKEIFNTIFDILKKLWSVIANIWNNLIVPNKESIKNFLNIIVDFVGMLLNILAKVFVWLSKIISTKESLGAFVSILGAILVLIGALTGNWLKVGIGVAVLGLGIGTSISGAVQRLNNTTISANNLPTYNSNTYTSSISQSVVPQTSITGTSLKETMKDALYEVGIGENFGGDVVLNLDGAEIARSKRFTSEINRKNAGINLK